MSSILAMYRSDTGKHVKCRAKHQALVQPLEKSMKINVLCKLPFLINLIVTMDELKYLRHFMEAKFIGVPLKH